MTYSIPYKNKGDDFKQKKTSKTPGSLSFKKYFIRKERYALRKLNAIKYKKDVELIKKEYRNKINQEISDAKKDIKKNYPYVSYETAIYIYEKITINCNCNYNLEKDVSIKKPKKWSKNEIKNWCELHHNLIIKHID